MRRALLAFGELFLSVVFALTLLAGAVAWFFELSFTDTLASAWFIGGLVTLGLAALMGSGYVGASYYKSPLMSLSSTYMNTIVREYPERRKGEFDTLIAGSLFGLALFAMAGLLVYGNWLIIPVILITAILVVILSRPEKGFAAP
jgi:hypothetical protein